MSYKQVEDFFRSKGFEREIMRLGESTATVDLAAAALGVAPDAIAKTLAFAQGDKFAVVVASGRARINNKLYKEQFGVKAGMLSPEKTLEVTGHGVGGVCPFGIPEGVAIYLDASLREHTTVYPAAGERDACLKMTLDELENLTGGKWVEVCQKPIPQSE